MHDREEIEYYHRGVICHLIGFDIAVVLDVEMLRPGEGEIVAAKRLLERVLPEYGRFFDAVVGDALYFEAPFFNFCIEHGKHVMAVIKGDQRALLQDAQGLFSQMTPRLWEEPRRLTEVWDEGGFTSVEGVKARLRVLHAHETITRRRRIAHEWLEEVEDHDWWWATTFPLSAISSYHLWRAGHCRWDVENDVFNTLSTRWGLDHCFKHEPRAITNFIVTLFIAFVLLQSFYLRNLKPPLRRHLTLIGLGEELHLSLRITVSPCPWLDKGG